MKKLNVILAAMFALLLSFAAQAQTPPADYFTGKWKVALEGTPGGDQTMFIELTRKDGKLTGGAFDPKTNKLGITFDRVEETPKSVTVYFKASGVDVFMNLDKQDDTHATGSMMDMFDAKAERVATATPVK
ncbi:hypothetical protein ACFST9_12970 [Hymenobacter monticola]|uniref:Uncharacterized protein n=1 Tax=Hymenobacter monticola TaxID=1705399 RepID=A0ABY4BB59_9BACT|nr:hypothetical protein [Hymenobacter monticola]UOE36398.1 hypothetical protein MTP16_23865 [Hymenobacter monticola]